MADYEFSTSIKKILEDKMAASAMDINVESKDSYIHLSGVVDTLGEKLAAEKIVNHIDGVDRVENNICIATDGYVTDNDTENYIKQKMMEVPQLSNVTPKVQGGAATLYGHVDNYADKKRAVEYAQQSLGVKNVASNIKIGTPDVLDDAQITSSVSQVFDVNKIDVADVDTTVVDGTVILQGYVRSSGEVELAEELVSKLDGVKKVKNRLKARKD